MVFDPSEFLTIGEQLLEDEEYKTEGGLRTSVGRSYYAAFLVIRKKLEELGVSIKQGYGQHQEVIDKLMDKNSHIGNKLHHLRDRRNDADYHLNANIDESLAKGCTKLSSIVVNSSDDLRF